MKVNKFLTLLLLIFLATPFWSCEKDENGDPNKPEEYGKLYMPKAKSDPVIEITMDEGMTDVFSVTLNAALEGPGNATGDFKVTFTVDNAKIGIFNSANQTEHKLLPSSAYNLSASSATIKKNTKSSEQVTVQIIPVSGLEEGGYLLPITVSSDDVAVNAGYATIYFEVIVPAAATEETMFAKKVLSLGQDWGNIISNGPDDVLYIRDKALVIHVYKPDKNRIYSIKPTPFPGDPWEISGWFYYIIDNIAMVINDDGHYGMFRFDIDPATYLLTAKETVNPADPWPTNFGFWYGDGWHRFNLLPQGDFLFFNDKATGDLYRVPMEPFLDPYVGTWHKPGWYEDTNNIIATGFGYPSIVSCRDHLVALDTDGKLWAYHISGEGELGNKKELGSGWNYQKIIATSYGLLGLDAKGDIYAYEISFDKVYNH